jgi:glycosyltransferase involved in cell wall biosynthesis
VSDYPFVSVVMPVRNEADYIERSLGAVLAQDYPIELMEILVVDGMSTDGTRDVVARLQAGRHNLRLISNQRMIVPTGLNLALAVAAGEIIIRVDGHCEIASDYVRRCVEHLRSGCAEAVGGPLETVGETPLAQAIATVMSSGFGVGGSSFRTVSDKTMFTDTVPFPAYTRAIIDRAGPYDEELVRNQDDEYNYRLLQIGGRILLADDVRSRYYSRSTLRSLWRQYLQYGYWKVRVAQKHLRQMRVRQFVPPLFVLALSTGLLVAPLSTVGLWLFGCVSGSYAIANLMASVVVARSRKPSNPALLPPAFAAIHLAYGLGFLYGLIRFSGRWLDRGSTTAELRHFTHG